MTSSLYYKLSKLVTSDNLFTCDPLSTRVTGTLPSTVTTRSISQRTGQNNHMELYSRTRSGCLSGYSLEVVGDTLFVGDEIMNKTATA